MKKYIFIVGGVLSGVGKGVTSASLGVIFKAKGFRATIVKADAYINVDAGTMNPIEHGEVFVTDDGDETDQDIGNYERFLDTNLTATNYMTTGRIYESVIHDERSMKYKGKCVQVVPHIPEEIIRRIQGAGNKSRADIIITEIGGTVGEYENILFLEAIRELQLKHPKDVGIVLVSYLPVPGHLGEMKTKPTQHASRLLNQAGLQADIIVARSQEQLDKPRREKLAVFCGVPKENCIAAPDVESIYEVPLIMAKQGAVDYLLKALNVKPRKTNLTDWKRFVAQIEKAKKPVKIGVVGKYFGTGDFTLADSYISVIEAVKHAAWHHNRKPEMTWIDSEGFEKNPKSINKLAKYDGIIVPGGFGTRGIEGIISAIKYAREHNKPYLGLCYGMQLASIEFARNVAGIKGAHTMEYDEKAQHPIVIVNPYQQENIVNARYGGTMRLGAYDCVLSEDTLARKVYAQRKISERHRHRYEFNNEYKARLEKAGMVFSGINPKQKLVEIIEIPSHPWFVGVQFHPEFKSRPMKPHPLFRDFVGATIDCKS